MGHYAGDRCPRLLLLQDVMCLSQAMSPCWTTATSHACPAPGGGARSRAGMLVVCFQHPSPAGPTTFRREWETSSQDTAPRAQHRLHHRQQP